MKQDTQKFLDFVDQELNTGGIGIEKWKEYLRILPHVYNSDISFRLLFDWHWDLALNNGRAFFKSEAINVEEPIFSKQIQLITDIGVQFYNLKYQF